MSLRLHLTRRFFQSCRPQVSCASASQLRSFFSTDTSSNNELSGYPGASTPFTTKLEFIDQAAPFKCFRRMTSAGNFVDPDYKVPVSDETLLEMYTTMRTLNVMDNVYYNSQRQGRISFYLTCTGEEGIHIGTAAGIEPQDMVYAQYREAGVLMWRGFSLQQFADQLFSNLDDLGKGRQMPIHYGSKELNFHTISSPLGTQIPHAVGAAYAFKRGKENRIGVCYFGEGAASEGDFHAALNMAATLEAPVLFICRNNGYAISTPASEQYRGDGIAGRAIGYGISTIRIDGNDTLAVYEATKEARRIILQEGKPAMIECMTYRGGHHSTSDDSTAYRDKEEIDYWSEERSPINRMREFLTNKGIWDGDKEIELGQDLRKQVLACMKTSESKAHPAMSQLFTDVYDELPANLVEQQQEMKAHVAKYADKYNVAQFAQEDRYVDPAPTGIEREYTVFPKSA